MSQENFVDTVEEGEVPVEAVSVPSDAPNTHKRVVGRPITKETARAYQLSSTQAKRARREARLKMLAALTHDLDMREELLKALNTRDSNYLDMLERATRLVGLQWEQSDEGREHRFNVKSDTTLKTDGAIKFVIEEAGENK